MKMKEKETKKEQIYERLVPGETVIICKNENGNLEVAENIDGRIYIREVNKVKKIEEMKKMNLKEKRMDNVFFIFFIMTPIALLFLAFLTISLGNIIMATITISLGIIWIIIIGIYVIDYIIHPGSGGINDMM